MLMAHKIALKPNNKQATYFAKACGVARFAYNWALTEWKQEYEAGGKPSQLSLRRKLNSIKKKEYPWMLEVTKNAPQMAIIQLGAAFKNFFAKRAAYPQYRKKGDYDRFTLTNDQFAIKDSHIRIPHLGWVRMCESLRFEGKIMSATISRTASRWFVSLTIDVPRESMPAACENQAAVGVDLGLSAFATLSSGEVVKGPKPHKSLLPRLRRLSKSLSRKEKGSNNRNKAKRKLAKLHARIANIRNNAIHQLTTQLTANYKTIGIEDLNVKGMVKNRCLSRSIADMGLHEFRRQLEYKAEMRKCQVVIANQWYASSKTCSSCAYKLPVLPLATRKWQCPECDKQHDRDLNAAINLEKLAVSSTASACGAPSDGAAALAAASHGVMKQEFNAKSTYV